MTTIPLVIAALAVIAALYYRQEMIAITTFAEQSRITFRWQYQQLERERDRHANEGREAWEAYLKAFRKVRKSETARVAAEDHVKFLRTQLDEAKARAEAAERSQEDTEVYGEETGAAEEAGAVQVENGPGEMVGDPNGSVIARYASAD